jgi:hypothetical protein
MRKKKGRDSNQQRTYDEIHKKIIAQLDEGTENPLKRAKSELATKLNVDRRTINKHLKEISLDVMVQERTSKKLWHLKRDVDVDIPFFLRYIFRYALRENFDFLKTHREDKGIQGISNEELEGLWHSLFGDSKEVVITFQINPQKLLEWVEGEGRDDFKRALPSEVWSHMHREASQLWKQREEWDKKLKPLERHYQSEEKQDEEKQ